MDNNSEIVAAYGKQLPTPGTSSMNSVDLNILFKDEEIKYYKDPYITNANAIYRNSYLKKNLFNEKLTNIEDQIWAKKASKENKIISYTAGSDVFHSHGIHQHEHSSDRSIKTEKIIKSNSYLHKIWEKHPLFNSKFYKNMIGIHIRKSDGGFTKLDWDSIIKKLLLQCKEWCVKDKDNGIFLATDDSSVYVDFAIKLGNKLIFYDPPKVLCDTSSSSYGKFNNDKYNVMCAVVELNLLGNCNKFIIGTCDSTFSVCAMLLSNKDTQKYLMNSVDSIPEFI
jgi:hypothetical protein